MKSNIICNVKEKVKPYRGVLSFFLIMFVANIVWKLSIKGDEDNAAVFLWSVFDISAFFNLFTQWLVDSVYSILSDLLGMQVNSDHFSISFDAGNAIRVIWGCSGIKQMFIFFMIILFSYGSWKNKLWFIPVGMLLCFFINIIRIVLLALIAYSYPAQLDLFHTYILKYAFYGIIFLFWIFWNENYGYDAKK